MNMLWMIDLEKNGFLNLLFQKRYEFFSSAGGRSFCSPSHSQGFSSVTRSSWSTRAAGLGGPLPRQWRQHFHWASQTAWKGASSPAAVANDCPISGQTALTGCSWGKWLSVPSPCLILTWPLSRLRALSFRPSWELCALQRGSSARSNPIITGARDVCLIPALLWGKGRQARAAALQCHTKINRGQNTSTSWDSTAGGQGRALPVAEHQRWCQSPVLQAATTHSPLTFGVMSLFVIPNSPFFKSLCVSESFTRYISLVCLPAT